MGTIVIKLPDVGEGIAEAELVEWSVKVGDFVREDDILAAVMTDKATVEIPSPVNGEIVWLGGEIGQQLAVGGPLVRIEVDGATTGEPAKAVEEAPEESASAPAPEPEPVLAPALAEPQNTPAEAVKAPPQRPREEAAPPSPLAQNAPRHVVEANAKPLAAPSVRLRARNAGIRLEYVPGSGPAGRITHEDLDNYIAGASSAALAKVVPAEGAIRDVKLIGMRRKIAERMANAKRRIPHISIIEEVDVTELETLRTQLNAERKEGQPKLTVLPFIMAAIVRAVKEQPVLNALFDDEAEIVREFSAVHIGIATQTEKGLMVPVVRHCERRTLWDSAAELNRVAAAARDGSATRDELTGSTITITSLGPLGAIATTPIINHPEVAIVGVNRMEVRPRWNGTTFVPRTMMNLSSSFDHRIIDGWDAAVFVKRLKTLLETPALMFVEM